MNKYMLVAIIGMTFCTVSVANETLWKLVKAAYESGSEEDWAKVVSVIESDKTIDKSYAPPGDKDVYHYVVAGCQFEIAAALEETWSSDIEEEPQPDVESLIMSDLLDEEAASPPARARSNAVRAAISPSLLTHSWK